MNDDINLLLQKIKENIKSVENNCYTNETLHEIETDFIDLMELIKLFLISERDTYYGYFLMNMRFQVNFFIDSIAGIRLNEFPPVFESNPLLLCKFRLKEIIYITCHEIDHVVLNHPAEMVKANPAKDQDLFLRFNLAADAAVNDRIDFEITNEKRKFMSKPKGAITSIVLSDMFNLGGIRKREHFAYYFDLIKNNGEKPEQQKDRMMMSLPSEESDSEEQTSPVEGSSEEKKIVTARNRQGNISDHQWEAGDDAEDVTANVRELINASYEMMSSESRGLMPSHFLEEVKKINEPPVLSWQAILKKYVGTITASKRKTRTRLNRRQPERFDLSGTVDEKVLKIVVAIDTSGSVSNKMISSFMNEIFGILAKRKHDITIIECDSVIRRVYKAKDPSEVKLKVMGRGGTMFSPVIEYINENKYYRDALLIYLTDGYGERKIPRPRTYRNIWVVIGNRKNLSLEETYGVVLTI